MPADDGRLRDAVHPRANPVRITRDELIVPPEFRDRQPVGHEAARVGGARIELVSRGTTQLGSCYQQIPVRVMPPFVLNDEPAALLYLINLTAGLLDGDAHLMQLTTRSGTRAVVTGQSATRIHTALHSYATQQWSACVEDDACLVVLPGPNIPYRGARYYQRARVEVAPRGRLIWGDIWLAGRYERGALSERHAFERIVQDLEVRREGRLTYRDRFCWDGPWDSGDVDWHVRGFLASASVYCTGTVAHELLPKPSHTLRRAQFSTESNDTCIRWCGPPAEVISDVVSCAMRIAGRWTGNDDARPWLLESTDLAPNHWFSNSPRDE